MVDRNSIIEKVKALLAKTTENGCTEEEELAALAKARAWIDAHEITDGELQLSREDYIAPKGERIEGNGVAPHVVVPRTLADFRTARDPDLEAALRILKDG